jgi:tetratricopeptide (TPR) repeat protein
MRHPVFISYARKASRAQAKALHEALGGGAGLAFLDTSELEPGDRFPPELADALLGARVVVVFASKEYFRRWYCLWEFEAALGPFLALRPDAPEAEKAAALAPMVIALPTQTGAATELLPLPPVLRTTNWPRADEVAALEKCVRARLRETARTVGERLDSAGRLGAGLRTRLLNETVLPPPKNLASVRMYPRSLASSLGESFVGRADELWRIHYMLSVLRDRRGEGSAGAALTGALHGAGGFGKTRLALEYLHRLGPGEHPGGMFWVNAEVGPESLEEQFHGILRTLRPEVPDLVTFRKSERDAAREMTEALESVAATERILYVVDNVPEPGAKGAQKPLRFWCPALGKVSLLATSRARLDLGVEGVHALPVSPLTPEAAVALLTEEVPGGSLDGEGWRRIAEWVGQLPLALELLNRTLRAGALEPGELLSRTESQGPVRELDQHMEVLRPHVPPGALRGITEAFSLSYANLSEAERLAARLIARLAPEPVPLKLFEALGPEVAVPGIRVTLRTRHFVTPAEAAGDIGMFGAMHRVLSDFLRGQSGQPREELWQVCRGLVALMSLSACGDPREWPLLNACLPHARSVFEQLLENGGNSQGRGSSGLPEGASKEFEGRADAVTLALSLTFFLRERGLPRQSREVAEQTVELARGLLGEKNLMTLTALGTLASILREQGNLEEARRLNQRVVEGMRQKFGEEASLTLAAMGNLADTLREQRKLEEARELNQRVVEGRARVLGEEHPDTFTAKESLVSTLYEKGDLEGARALAQRVLEEKRRALGEEHPDTFKAMGNLASILHEKKKLEEARELAQRGMEGLRRMLGEEHPDTLTAMENLARMLREQQNLEGARVLEQRVVKGRARVLGEEHPDTFTAKASLISTLYEEGNLEEARELGQRVLEERLRVLGEEHPDTLNAMANLAVTLHAQEKLEEARELSQRAVKGLRRVFGEEHPGTLKAMANLAVIFREQGNPEGAQALEQRVLEVRLRLHGEEHMETLTAMWHLAVTLHALGNLEEGQRLAQRVKELRRRVRPEEYPDTNTRLLELKRQPSTLQEEGKPSAVRALTKRVLDFLRRVLRKTPRSR